MQFVLCQDLEHVCVAAYAVLQTVDAGKPQETGGEMVWANDNRTLFYTTKDALDRPNKLWRHVIGGDPAADEVVFHEVPHCPPSSTSECSATPPRDT